MRQRLRRLPAHRVLGHELRVMGENLAPPERAHQRFAEAPFVGLLHIAVGGDERPQVLAQLHVGGWAVVDGADADVQELAGHIAGLLGDRLDQRVAERGLAEVGRVQAGDVEKAQRSSAARPS